MHAFSADCRLVGSVHAQLAAAWQLSSCVLLRVGLATSRVVPAAQWRGLLAARTPVWIQVAPRALQWGGGVVGNAGSAGPVHYLAVSCCSNRGLSGSLVMFCRGAYHLECYCECCGLPRLERYLSLMAPGMAGQAGWLAPGCPRWLAASQAVPGRAGARPGYVLGRECRRVLAVAPGSRRDVQPWSAGSSSGGGSAGLVVAQ